MMDPLETLIKTSRPAPLPAGPHRDRLARLLRERRASARPESWTTLRYAIALAAGALCLMMAIVTQPRPPAPQYFYDERQLLASFLTTTPAVPQGPYPVIAPERPQPQTKDAPPQSPGQILREQQESLDQILNDTSLQQY